jgi:glycosyltransferase involved in cell wall biosynthesis
MNPSLRPRVSVVVRAYNEEEHIGRLLTGLMRQTLAAETEILLVDSGSTDATVAIAARYPVRVLHIRPEEFTFGRSLNLGVAEARGELVAIASAHVYPVYPDWLERLLAPFADPQVALVYGKQRGDAATRFSERQVFARWFPERSVARQPHPFCNNANAAIRRALWETHAYDETLTGLEDLAWARWAIEQGFHLAYAAEAEVAHIHNETPRAVYNRYRREAMAYKRIFPQEQFNFVDLLRLFTTNALSDFRHALAQGAFREHAGSILWFRWMQFWGTYRGYRQAGPLTWRLRQTFYYPRSPDEADSAPPRDIAPIRYSDSTQQDEKDATPHRQETV